MQSRNMYQPIYAPTKLLFLQCHTVSNTHCCSHCGKGSISCRSLQLSQQAINRLFKLKCNTLGVGMASGLGPAGGVAHLATAYVTVTEHLVLWFGYGKTSYLAFRFLLYILDPGQFLENTITSCLKLVQRKFPSGLAWASL